MERIKLDIQYDGTNFCGYQIQPEKRTIQGELEKALKFLLKDEIKTYASGRTDSGVSAFHQTVHFDTNVQVESTKKLTSSLNALLPDDVAVISAEKVSVDFDARFSVKKKTYQYRFYISKDRLPLYMKTAVRLNDYANIEKMQEACKYFIGTHNFEAFKSQKCEKTDFVRTIYESKIVKLDEFLYAYEITGSGFLYNMVRIIFGTLVMVGYGKYEPNHIEKLLAVKDRQFAGKTMPAHALVLKSVEYQTKSEFQKSKNQKSKKLLK